MYVAYTIVFGYKFSDWLMNVIVLLLSNCSEIYTHNLYEHPTVGKGRVMPKCFEMKSDQ